MAMFENWTPKEERCIEELRTLLKKELTPALYDDTYFIYRFLKARNFKLNQAEAMLRKHLLWRKMAQIETTVTDYKPPEVLKYLSQSFIGFDKDGSPVRYSAVGNVDLKGIAKSVNKIDIAKCCFQVIESDVLLMKEQSKKLGKPVRQCFYIYDVGELNLVRATDKNAIAIFLMGISMFQDNYPEILKKIFVINASTYFTAVFPVFKNIVARSILSKMTVFGRDGWREQLLKRIDADVLPVFLGGTKTDEHGDPFCSAFVCRGGTVPRKYYLTKDVNRFASKNGVQKIIVEKQSSSSIEIDVTEQGSILNWEFELRCYDIGFQLLVEETYQDETVSTELIPALFPMETEYEPIRGTFNCTKLGTYFLVFDNTYSWFNSKEVYCRTWLTKENSS